MHAQRVRDRSTLTNDAPHVLSPLNVRRGFGSACLEVFNRHYYEKPDSRELRRRIKQKYWLRKRQKLANWENEELGTRFP